MASMEPSRSAPPTEATSPALSGLEHQRLADVLLKAARDRRPLEPLSVQYPELTFLDASRIRDAVLARRIAAADRPIGAKVSLGGAWPGRHEEPRLAWLTNAMVLAGSAVDIRELIQPRVEPKIALLLARPLRRPVSTIDDLLADAAGLVACLEVLDSRYGTARPSAVDDLADNCASAKLLIGEGVAEPAGLLLRRLRVQLEAARAEPRSSVRRVTPGFSQSEAMLWLANQALEQLDSGDLLLGPALVPAVRLMPGALVRARFNGLDPLELRAR